MPIKLFKKEFINKIVLISYSIKGFKICLFENKVESLHFGRKVFAPEKAVFSKERTTFYQYLCLTNHYCL